MALASLTLFDAYAIVAYLRDEPCAAEVCSLLGDRTRPRAVSAVNLAEVLDVSVRVHRHPPAAVHDAVALLRASGLEVIVVDEQLAARARVCGCATTTGATRHCRWPTAARLPRRAARKRRSSPVMRLWLAPPGLKRFTSTS